MTLICTVKRQMVGLAVTLATWSASPAWAQPTPDTTYDAPETWLCRPGRSDACSVEQSVTQLAADGTRAVITLKPARDAPIDCFYVYPTISQDPNPHSTLQVGPGELRAVAQQFAPFASVCRPFAPMYRQITLAGLRNAMTGNPAGIDPERPIEDVRAAWRNYLARDNQGRGVVLVGHSQGSRMLSELLKRDVDGQPTQARVVSALLIGSNFLVPTGADTGGTLRSMPVCRTGTQTGCIVAFTSFRASAPPPADTRFGRSQVPGSEVACIDPVQLSGMPMRSLLWREATLLGQPALRGEWEQALAGVNTPFVDLPGLMTTACARGPDSHYLAVRFDETARGARPRDIPGDLIVAGRTYHDWGLHLVDVNLALGNLLELVRRQGEAWRRKPQ